MIILAKNLEFSKQKARIVSTSTRRRILRAGAEREKSEKSSLTSSTSFLFNIFIELSQLFDVLFCSFVSSRFYFTLGGYMEGGREGGGEGVEMFLWVSGGIQREQLIIEKERKKERKKESTGFLFYLRFCHCFFFFFYCSPLYFLFTSRGRNMVGHAEESIIV
jgi:hypothetical protein